MSMTRIHAILAAVLFAGASQAEPAAIPACDASGPAVQEIPVSGEPFSAIASKDGCTIYVSSRTGRSGRIAAFKRGPNGLSELGYVSASRAAFGIALTSDGALLIVAEGDGVMFVDTARLQADRSDAALAYIDDSGRGAIYVATTPDDRLLFVSDEHSQSIGVIDLAKARSNGFSKDAVLGSIRVGTGPVGLALSSDGRTLFASAQIVPWPRERVCRPESERESQHHEGALLAIDVERTRTDPAHAVIGGVPAGCNPVRVALSPAGDRAYVTARGSNALLVFDTAKLKTGNGDALIATITVGTAPVGVAAVGNMVIVTNSDRFGRGKSENQTLTVIAADKIGLAADPVIGTVEVRAFPRELHVTADGKALLVANAGSSSLMLFRLSDMPVKSGSPAAAQ